jgi:peptidoglycan/xylan/chitin deacetylase (PgdA/CDA1 family)
MRNNRTHKKEWAITHIAFLAGVLLWLSSCTSLKIAPIFTEQANSTEESPKGKVFQSEDYVLYELEDGDTPAVLAKAFLGDEGRAWVIEDENRSTIFEKGQFVVIPLKDTKKGGLEEGGYQVVPILCYHRLAEQCKTNLCLTVDAFKRQIEYLKDNGYRAITMTEFFGFLQYRHGIPTRSVVITFDDGYRSFYDIALPILQKHGYKATLFVYTDFIGHSKDALTWKQLKQIKAEGFEIGSHGVSHTDLTKRIADEAAQVYIARVKEELFRSKKIIDQKLNQDTAYFAFPFGSHNPRILRWTEQAGYKLGLSAKKGSNPFFADPLTLKRNQIIGQDIKHFIASLVIFEKSSLKEDHVQ